jgi:predicted lysophospholipase L1 biosynthesis ABC-type transport system permease subunit
MIINETAARTVFPGQDPIGQTALTMGDQEFRIVGVVGDVRHQSLEQESGIEMYLPYTQVGFPTLTMVVRSRLPAATLVPSVRAALRDVDPDMPTDDFEKLGDVVDRAVSPRRFILLLIGGFATTALILAALGIYAVLSHSVVQRIPEIGIRMALGESAGEVRRRVVGRTLALAGVGIGIGGVLALVTARLMRSLLFGIGATDPLSFAGMAAVLLLVAFVAGWLPARRASRTDPVVALRST